MFNIAKTPTQPNLHDYSASNVPFPPTTCANGACYVGETLNGLPHGHGQMQFQNGVYYTGTFKYGKFDGQGKLLSNTESYNGMFSNGKFHGFGKQKDDNGGVYIGFFSQGLRHGMGNFTSPDCTVYHGPWQYGHATGFGTKNYHTRQYKGNFLNGVPDGQGCMLFNDGTIYSGGFLNGNFYGLGTYSYNQNEELNGVFQNGQLVLNSKDAYDIYNQLAICKINEFNHIFNDLERITFTGQKIKKNGISIHEIIINRHNKTERAWLIKKSSENGRENKLKNGSGLGYGTFKFAQIICLFFADQTYLKCALTTQEYNGTMPSCVQSELINATKLTNATNLSQVVVPTIYFNAIGKTHVDSNGFFYPAGKKYASASKLLGLMPISNNATYLCKQGTTEQKKNFVFGVLNTLIRFQKQTVIHQDIKPQNLDCDGRSIDNGSLLFNPSDLDCDDYGTPGYHCLYQQRSVDVQPFSKQLKERQDSFAAAATIFEVLTGQQLDSNIVNGKFLNGPDGKKYYVLTPISDEQFHQKINDIRHKINTASFPFDDLFNQALKTLLLNMTGTNDKSPHNNGNNLHGDDVLNILAFLTR